MGIYQLWVMSLFAVLSQSRQKLSLNFVFKRWIVSAMQSYIHFKETKYWQRIHQKGRITSDLQISKITRRSSTSIVSVVQSRKIGKILWEAIRVGLIFLKNSTVLSAKTAFCFLRFRARHSTMAPIGLQFTNALGEKRCGILNDGFGRSDFLKLAENLFGNINGNRFFLERRQLILDNDADFARYKHLIINGCMILMVERMVSSSKYPLNHELVDKIFEEVSEVIDKTIKEYERDFSICLGTSDRHIRDLCI